MNRLVVSRQSSVVSRKAAFLTERRPAAILANIQCRRKAAKLHRSQSGFTPLETNSHGKGPKLHQSLTGFTIIELLIATAAFSVILLICTVALVQVGKLYYKGVNSVNTQELSRSIMEEISRQVQFGGNVKLNVAGATYGTAPNTVTVSSFCIAEQRYSYVFGAQVYDSVGGTGYNVANHRIRHALWRDTMKNGTLACTPLDLTQATPQDGNTLAGSGRELLAPNTRLSNLTLTPLDAPTNNLWQIDSWVVYGDDDLLAPAPQVPPQVAPTAPFELLCKGGPGSDFCTTSELSTVVRRRL